MITLPHGVASTPSGAVTFAALDEDVVFEIARAAQAAGVLAPLASSSRQLCSSARSATAYSLHVRNQAQAMLILTSAARGRPPFSGCTQLCLQAADLPACSTAFLVMGVAQQWPGLQQLQLSMAGVLQHLQPGPMVDACTPCTLSGLRGLRQLRSLDLTVPSFNAASAGHVAQLVHLTHLKVAVEDAAVGAPADLCALSGLSRLRQLVLARPPAVQPAAGPEGPFCLPSSLAELSLNHHLWYGFDCAMEEGAIKACWVTHLPACGQLRTLWLDYGNWQHAGAHANAVVQLLAQHNRQLRALRVLFTSVDPAADVWVPDAHLAALRGLEVLCGGHLLEVCTQEHWQHLAQLSALTMLESCRWEVALQQGAGTLLALLKMHSSEACLGGRDLGLLLLACPVLQQASMVLSEPEEFVAEPAGDAPLPQHSSLQQLSIMYDPTEDGSAAHFAALASVIRGVSSLELQHWQFSSSAQPAASLPDLAAFTALADLSFGVWDDTWGALLQQEDVVLMLAPLVHLRTLRISGVPCISARVVGWLQGLMPQLQHVSLAQCGRLVPLAVQGVVVTQEMKVLEQQAAPEEAQALAKVRRLLRPGLVLMVYDLTFL